MDILSGINIAVAAAIPLVAALTLHEVAKAWVAKKLGDKYTIRSYNPMDYIDKIGTLGLPLLAILLTQSLVIFGWAIPARINANNIASKKDRIILYLSGSIANFLMMFFWFLLSIGVVLIQSMNLTISELPMWEMMLLMCKAGLTINSLIIAFSLFPLLPFDGGKIVEEFLPRNLAIEYRKVEPYSMYIMLFIVFFTPIMRYFVGYIEKFNMTVLTSIMGLII